MFFKAYSFNIHKYPTIFGESTENSNQRKRGPSALDNIGWRVHSSKIAGALLVIFVIGLRTKLCVKLFFARVSQNSVNLHHTFQYNIEIEYDD